jgi:parvulin-like peptidyl-prolyl isomerase
MPRPAQRLPLIAMLLAVAPAAPRSLFAAPPAATAAATAAAPEAAAPQDKSIVAVVNAEPISADFLAEEAVRRHGIEILDNMINRHLIMQACTAAGVEVTQGDVSEEIHRIAAKFNLPTDQYLKLLNDEREITPDQYAREVIWPMMALRRLVSDKLTVSEEEFARAYAARYGEAVKCRLIMVNDEKLARSLRDKAVANPNDFPTLAKQHSQDEASASVGGLIPPIRRFAGNSQIEDVAFALQENQISDVMQMADQWIILQAVKKMPAANPSPQAMAMVKEQINDEIRDAKVRDAATELFRQLQEQAQVVKVLGDEALTQQNPGVAAIVNGQKVPVAQVAAECVKRYGSTVLDGEINRKLLTQALGNAKTAVTQADLDAEVARAAVAYGFVDKQGKADSEAWIASVLSEGVASRDLYYRDSVWPSVALSKLVEAQVQVTEDDMREGFESNYGPRCEILAIVLSDQRTAQKVWDLARNNPTEEFFGNLAEQYSVEPVSQSNFGKVPPLRQHGGQPALEKEAFALKPGELSGIVATGDKFVILKCQGFTEPLVTNPADVQAELLTTIREKKGRVAMAKYFDQLKEKSQIDNFFELAKKASGVPNSVAAPAIQGSPAAAGVRGTVQPAAATQPGRVAPAAAAAPQGRVQR